MDLPETLVYSDITTLNRIAKYYDIPCNLSSKNELIQSILQRVLNTQEIINRVSQVSEVEYRFLLIMLLEGKQGFTFEDLLAKASQALRTISDEKIEVASQRKLINGLLNKGWLYLNLKDTGRPYHIPRDLRLRLLNEIKNKADLTRRIPRQSTNFTNEIVQDLMTFLKFVDGELIHLTTEGVIHKRQQLQLLDRMTYKESPIDRREWRFGYGRRFHNYPDRFSLIYDFCFHQGYIVEHRDSLSLTGLGTELKDGVRETHRKAVYNFWLKQYRKPIRNLPFLIDLFKFYTDDWIACSTLEKQMVIYIKPFHYDSPQHIFRKRILRPLIWFGYVEIDTLYEPQFVKIASLGN